MTAPSPAGREDNNFDLLRLALATTVFLVHSADLSGHPALRRAFSGLSSYVAVQMFFVISGYLVLRSYERSSDGKDYALKRVRRVYPAYVAALLLSAILGAFLTELPASSYVPGALRYLGANLVFANFLVPELPGVFADNPVRAVNGALWTLKSEVLFYAALPLGVALAKRLGKLRFLAAVYLLSTMYRAGCELAYADTGRELYRTLSWQFPGQLSCFAAGAFVHWAPRLEGRRWLPWVCAGFATLALRDLTGVRLVLEPAALGVLTLWAALGLPALGRALRGADLSYGVYILHFPLLQTLISTGPATPGRLLGLGGALLFGLAAISWHLLEKRFLRRPPPAAATLIEPRA